MNPGRLVDTSAGFTELLRATRTVAVLGIKPESHADQPAHYVPAYLASVGYTVIPVPVYYPRVTEILGRPVVRTLADAAASVGGTLDLVNLFRRSEDVPKHLDELLAVRPRAVWMQLGIRHAEVTRRLLEAGIDVVEDRCILVERQRMG
jgi:predicted CoA-binding protein